MGKSEKSKGPQSLARDRIIEESLFGYFEDEIHRKKVLAQCEWVILRPEEVLCKEGERALDLFVVVEGTLNLFTGADVPSGTLTAGRSLNLYSVLHAHPFHYTARAAGEVKVIKCKWSKVRPYFDAIPGLTPYLELVTQNSTVRALAKEMDELGISRGFKAQMLGSLRVTHLEMQQFVVQQGDGADAAFIVHEGSVHGSHRNGGTKVSSTWRIPNGTWYGVKELDSGQPFAASFRTSSKTCVLRLDRSSLEDVREQFEEDFQKYFAFITKTLERDEDEDDEDEDDSVDELETLFGDPKAVRKKTFLWKWPHVSQHDQMDCGPACLAMISKYYRNELNIQFWRQRLHTNQLGTTLYDLAATAEHHGFITQAIGVEALEDLDQIFLPAIALRQYHYIVVYEIKNGRVTIGDPAIGIRQMSLQEFNEGFEQAILLLRPTHEFSKQSAPSSRYSHFFKLASGFGPEMLLVGFTSILAVGFSMATPFLLQTIFDTVIPNRDFGLLMILLLAGVTSSLCQAVLSFVRSHYVTYISSKFDFIASSAFFKKLFSLPYEFIATRHVGDFTHRLYEMERLREYLTSQVLQIVLDLITMSFFVAVLFMYNPKILGLTLFFCSLLVVTTTLFTKKLNLSYTESFTSRAEQESLVTDTIKSIPTIKTLNADVVARWRLEEKIARTLQARKSFSLTRGLLFSTTEAIDQISKFLLVGMAAYLAIKGNFTAGQVISISVLVRNVIDPFNALAHSWSGIQEAKSIANRLNDVFLADSEKKQTGSGNRLSKVSLRGEIEFQNVWFRYGGESNNWALRDVSFKIEAGQSVAITGPSGSGKTTIGQLLARLYEPTRGRILIDGRDLSDYDPAWIRKKMGFILQEPNLFLGSIAENIALASPTIDEERVLAVAEIAHATEFILQKPGGFHYQITHGGLGLSGGEKQRIAFARALYSDPQILVLDEATSAMDGISEKAVMTALKGGKRTMINIAHRFSTAVASDFVMVMEKGQLVGLGSHAYLSESNDLYRALFNLDDFKSPGAPQQAIRAPRSTKTLKKVA